MSDCKSGVDEHGLPFIIKNGCGGPLTHEELKQMLKLFENEIEDILRKRTKAYSKNKEKLKQWLWKNYFS